MFAVNEPSVSLPVALDELDKVSLYDSMLVTFELSQIFPSTARVIEPCEPTSTCMEAEATPKQRSRNNARKPGKVIMYCVRNSGLRGATYLGPDNSEFDFFITRKDLNFHVTQGVHRAFSFLKKLLPKKLGLFVGTLFVVVWTRVVFRVL